MDKSLDQILKKAEDVVKRAGEKARAALNQIRHTRYKTHGDMVTDMDLLINDMITGELSAMFPRFGFVTEEGGSVNAERKFVWVLDPIDGTKHYRIGNPFYGISLALRRYGCTCLAVVLFPSLGELFTASEGQGAYLNGKRIFTSPDAELTDAIICAEIPSRHDDPETFKCGMERLQTIIANCLRIRIIGITSLNLCYCAASRYDAYVNVGTFTEDWDLAGGALILKEAGGVISRRPNIIVGGAKRLHDRLVKLLSESI